MHAIIQINKFREEKYYWTSSQITSILLYYYPELISQIKSIPKYQNVRKYDAIYDFVNDIMNRLTNFLGKKYNGDFKKSDILSEEELSKIIDEYMNKIVK